MTRALPVKPRPWGTVTLVASAVAAILAGANGALAEEGPRAPEPVRLMLLWTHQAQFAGCYVAKEKGLYLEKGLDVQILRGGPDRDPLKALEEGKADFAILWLASALSAIDRGVPLVLQAQLFQESNLAIIGWKERGIESPRDLDARRVSVWGDPFRPAFEAFFRAQGVRPRVVPQYGTVNLFLLKGVDACAVMDYNEAHAIHLAGVDSTSLSTFRVAEAGFNFPEDGIYCLRRTREARPEAALAVTEATLEGWKYAAEHRDEALSIVMGYVLAEKLPTNETRMRLMLQDVLDSVFPQGERQERPGLLSRKDYEETAGWLRRLDVVRATPTYEEIQR